MAGFTYFLRIYFKALWQKILSDLETQYYLFLTLWHILLVDRCGGAFRSRMIVAEITYSHASPCFLPAVIVAEFTCEWDADRMK